MFKTVFTVTKVREYDSYDEACVVIYDQGRVIERLTAALERALDQMREYQVRLYDDATADLDLNEAIEDAQAALDAAPALFPS